MLQAQSHHLSSTHLQHQQQHKYSAVSTWSPLEHAHHLHTSTTSPRHPSDVPLPTSRHAYSSMTSSRPQPLPVPVARSSFRIDDILGDGEVGRDGTPRSAPSKTKAGRSSTSTVFQTSRNNSDEVLSDDITQRHLHHHHHHRHHEQQQAGQHGNPEKDVDKVELRPLLSKPPRPSIPDVPFRHPVRSGGQSSTTSPPSPRTRSPSDVDVGVDGAVQVRQPASDQHIQLSPSTSNTAAASLSPYEALRPHHHHHQQQHHQYGPAAQSVESTLIGSHHPLLRVPPSSSPFSVPSLDHPHLHALFAGRHFAFQPQCKFSEYSFTQPSRPASGMPMADEMYRCYRCYFLFKRFS